MEGGEGSGELGEKIWERAGKPKKKEEGGRREKKERIKMMLGPDTPKDPMPSIWGQEDRNGRRKTHPQGLLSKASDSWILLLIRNLLVKPRTSFRSGSNKLQRGFFCLFVSFKSGCPCCQITTFTCINCLNGFCKHLYLLYRLIRAPGEPIREGCWGTRLGTQLTRGAAHTGL